MKPVFATRKLVVLIICLTPFTISLNAQHPNRYFVTLERKPEALTITVLHPTTATIQALMALQEENFFPIEDIIVVGAYHEKELSDYEEAKAYVNEAQLDWFTFHEIRGEIKRDNLFQKNECTADFEMIFEDSSASR